MLDIVTCYYCTMVGMVWNCWKLTLLVRSSLTSVSKMTFSRGRLLFHVLGSCTRLINRKWKLCHNRQWILWSRAISRKWKRGLRSDRSVLLFDILFRFSLVSLLKWVNLGRKARRDSWPRYKYFSITVRFVVADRSNFYTQGQLLLLLLLLFRCSKTSQRITSKHTVNLLIC